MSELSVQQWEGEEGVSGLAYVKLLFAQECRLSDHQRKALGLNLLSLTSCQRVNASEITVSIVAAPPSNPFSISKHVDPPYSTTEEAKQKLEARARLQNAA